MSNESQSEHKRPPLGFRVGAEVDAQLRELARRGERTLSQEIRLAVREHLERAQPEEGR